MEKKNIYIYINKYIYIYKNKYIQREFSYLDERERRVHYHWLAKKARTKPNNKKQVQTTGVKERL